MKNFSFLKLVLILFIVFAEAKIAFSQEYQLVWSDEFPGNSLNTENWNFELGTPNDHIHYYTSRPDNCQVQDGNLQIIVKRESYMGREFTSSLINTINKVSLRYGKIEARIKVANSPGLVSAFWLLPVDAVYGFWPKSGEIDIMEHPTHEPQNIYGTNHTGAYNWFNGGNPPKGGVIAVPDLADNYHIYAIEWTPDSIHHLMDGIRYYSFGNENISTDTWPFDQAFYIILNVSVGGGWSGNPAPSDPFPDTMMVDYVRLYQNPDNILISGPDFLANNSDGIRYQIPTPSVADIEWTSPDESAIQSGQGTGAIVLDWGNIQGTLTAKVTSNADTITAYYPVVLSSNRLWNGEFEKGVKYWKAVFAASTDAAIMLDRDAGTGNHFIRAEIATPGSVAWDAQLVQRNIQLEAAKEYIASFRAKAENGGNTFAVSIINSQDYQVYSSLSATLTGVWTTFTLNFTMPENADGLFNFDLAGQAGTFFIDDVTIIKKEDLTVLDLKNYNPENPSEIIFPNPTREFVTVENRTSEPVESVMILDLTGKHILKMVPGNDQNPYDVNISGLTSGTYIISIKRKSGYSYNRFIIP